MISCSCFESFLQLPVSSYISGGKVPFHCLWQTFEACPIGHAKHPEAPHPHPLKELSYAPKVNNDKFKNLS